jgi:hypothetical protein
MFRLLYRFASLVVLCSTLFSGGWLVQARSALPVEPQARPNALYLPLMRNGPEPERPAERTPLEIAVSYTSALSTTAQIGSEGGQLATTGANGTLYTLFIPPGALAYTRTVTMIPAAAVVGLPFSGDSIGAVQLEPANLWLMQSALLTITTTIEGEADEVYAYGFEGSGAEFHLQESESSTTLQAAPAGVKIITLKPRRLRGYGASKGNQADKANYRQRHQPANPAHQMTEESFYHRLDRDELLTKWRGRYNEILQQFGAASVDPIFMDRALMMYEEWLTPINRLPWLKEELANEIANLREALRTAVKAASAKSAERCVSEKSPARGLEMQKWLYALYTYALPMDTSTIEAQVTKCLTFDLLFFASFRRMSQFETTSVDIHTDVGTNVRLEPRFAYPRFALTGVGNLYVTRSSMTTVPCDTRFRRTGVEPVQVLELLVSPHPDGDGIWVDALYFNTGKGVKGIATVTCPGGQPHEATMQHFYSTEFVMMHADEMIANTNGGGIFRISEPWKQASDSSGLVATTGAAYVRSEDFSPSTTIDEDTTFELYYRPQS